MLTVHHLSKSYSLNTILSDVSFNIGPGERIGLIGPNGCGKTTLLRILAGQIPLLAGKLSLGASVQLGYMAQEQELVDPPINHLDIPSRERFEQALTNFPGVILAVVHDRYFVQRFTTDL